MVAYTIINSTQEAEQRISVSPEMIRQLNESTSKKLEQELNKIT